jgi:hypothetical protein
LEKKAVLCPGKRVFFAWYAWWDKAGKRCFEVK